MKTYTFNENLKYMNESMFDSNDATLRTLHNWIELSAGMYFIFWLTSSNAPLIHWQ